MQVTPRPHLLVDPLHRKDQLKQSRSGLFDVIRSTTMKVRMELEVENLMHFLSMEHVVMFHSFESHVINRNSLPQWSQHFLFSNYSVECCNNVVFNPEYSN